MLSSLQKTLMCSLLLRVLKRGAAARSSFVNISATSNAISLVLLPGLGCMATQIGQGCMPTQIAIPSAYLMGRERKLK